MNEVEYLLKQDAREKKAAGRGIYHKRSGSKTHYVGLPSDKMTAAEWKRRNGPIMSYNITKAIRSYDEFKNLPVDLASTYLHNLRKTYNVSLTMVAESMGAKPSTLSEHIRAHGIDAPFKAGNPGRPALHWQNFLNGEFTSLGNPIPKPAPSEEPAPVEETTPEPMPEPAPESTADPKPESVADAKPYKATATKLRFSAGGTPEQLLDLIMTALADMTKPDRWYELDFSVRENGVVGGDE